MDKFDKILREKLQNHDAGMANGAWEQFAQNNVNHFDSFENAVRNKVENHDAGMNNGAWEQFAERLNPASSWKYYLTGGIAAALIGVGAYFYFSGDDSVTEQNKVQVIENTNPIAKNNTAINNSTIDLSNPTNINSNTPKVNNNRDKEVVTNNDGTVEIKKDTKEDIKTVANEVKKDKDKVISNEIVKIDRKEDAKVDNNNDIAVSILVKPEFSIEASEVCQNGDLTLKATNSKADYEITWLVNGEEVSSNANAKLIFHKTGIQQVQLVYSAMITGKRVISESEKATINVLTLPTTAFEVNKTNVESIPEFTLAPEKVDGGTYLWNFGDGKFSTDVEAIHVFRKRGMHPITLTVTGANGCQAKVTNNVETNSDFNLLAPNAFTPGGDGTNETFMPAALTIMNDVHFRMTIFDRSGKKVFETSRADNGWDGMNATNGTKCSSAAYVWRVQINLPNGGKEEYMGSVTLIN